jgi:hypothetical protein
MDQDVEEVELEEKELELHANPIPVVLQPQDVFNKYEIYDSPSWHYVYKVNCLLFCLGLSVGYFLGMFLPPIES